jgi:hypothetical protein
MFNQNEPVLHLAADLEIHGHPDAARLVSLLCCSDPIANTMPDVSERCHAPHKFLRGVNTQRLLAILNGIGLGVIFNIDSSECMRANEQP